MKIIDLSHTLESGMPVYPGDEAPGIRKSATHEKDGVQVCKLRISTHTGTHLDTPRHFVASGDTTDKMDLDKFVGKGVIIDCRDYGRQQQIPLSHIEKYKAKLESADFALIYTAWHHHWGTNEYFDHFPVPSVEANEFLVSCNLKGIGIDSSSIDSIDSTNFPNHNLVLGKGIIIIENLANLDQLIDTDFQFAAFPLKIKEGDGSPVRAVAIVGN